MTEAVVALAPASGMTAATCAALGVSRASVQRGRARLIAPAVVPRRRPSPTRALTVPQRRMVLDLLHAPRFADQAPAEVYASLLDEGVYHCSIRTMYRVLEDNDELRERRNQLRHPVYRKPELLAERPNQVWSWDITKLMGPTKWSYFYLYVILDIFSRRVVAWYVADAESAALFRPLLDDAIAKHHVPPGQLTLHADRGGPMKAKATALLLADLGVTRSHNRPHTSNDNPFSESHFKTLKYQPRFPKRFGCIEDAKSFCRSFFDWYNKDHHHAGIGLMTPDQVHYGQTDAVHAARQDTLDRAFRENPQRFVNKPPSPPNKPTAAWINPPVPRRATTEDTESREVLRHGLTGAWMRTIQPFVGETERAIRRSRPKLPCAGSGGRVKGAKRDRSHAQRNEHGEDQLFDAPEHLATIVNGWPESDEFPIPATGRGERKPEVNPNRSPTSMIRA
jgi:putative transposase